MSQLIYINSNQSDNIEKSNEIASCGLSGLSYDEFREIETPNFISVPLGKTLRQDVKKQLKVHKMDNISLCLPLNELYRLCESIFFEGNSTDCKSGNCAKKFADIFDSKLEKLQL